MGTTDVLRLLRPANWIKNAFVIAPAFFAGELFNGSVMIRVLLAATAFCLGSSAVYSLNDVTDAESDRRNPGKSFRPVASGKISRTEALAIGGAAATASLVLSYFAGGASLICIIIGYLLLNAGYSLRLKRIAIADITIIAFGFILRLYAGSTAAGCPLSQWIVMLTFILTLFLALGKRREDASPLYSRRFIDSAMSLLGAAAITSYFLYTLFPNPGRIVTSPYLYTTGIPVVIAIIRYLQICVDDNRGAVHHRVIFRDPLIASCIAIYIILFISLWLLDS
ncbi:MAG: UbiA prenyltransferase family protein [Clostridium sp.]|nr:UbiA prenyltransferase family protein [Clostridium sp.]